MFRNLLRYTASPAATKRPALRYAGGETTREFFDAALFAEDLQPVVKGDWTAGLGEGDLLILGDAVTMADVAAQAGSIAAFVKTGGTLLCAGDWAHGPVTWTPVPLQVRKLPQRILSNLEYSTGAFHLWKRSQSRLLDGLGDLYLFNSKRAQSYYIGDPIPGLTHGFVKPQSPWTVGYEIAVRATCSYKGLRRRSHYESEGDAAVAVLEHGKGRYILSSLPAKKTELSTKLYGALLANLNAPTGKAQPLLAFATLKANISVKPADTRAWRSYTAVDLVPYANRTFMDKDPEDKLGGWDDSGENDMRNLPTGDFVMNGVPFHIIDGKAIPILIAITLQR